MFSTTTTMVAVIVVFVAAARLELLRALLAKPLATLWFVDQADTTKVKPFIWAL